jgi:cytidine deaminase
MNDLVAAAREAAGRAYAPYSRYRVGAAVVDAAGHTFVGCNVESASYGLSMCAERVAIFSAVAGGAQRPLQALALVCLDGRADACAPCGACRQVMVEHLAPAAKVYFGADEVLSPEELLPSAFRLQADWPR